MACNVTCVISWLYIFLQIPIVCMVLATANKIPALIVFGDSTVDSGNNNFIPTIARADFPPYGQDFPGGSPTGRFCNGRLVSDFISESLGLNPIVPAFLDPTYNMSSFATAVSFASAGTGMDIATSNLLKVMTLWKQLELYKDYQKQLRAYLGNVKADEILREALYFISIGSNDFLLNYFLLPGKQLLIPENQYSDFMITTAEKFYKELYNLGARKLFVVGLAPIGCVPAARTLNINFQKPHECINKFNEACLDVNGKLIQLVAKLNSQLPGLKLALGDAYNIFSQIVSSPSSFGFEVADRGCCASGRIELGFLCNKDNPLTCEDASKYIFWDSVHPTERVYQIVTKPLIKQIQKVYL